MKKRYLLLLMGMFAVCSVSGCGKSGSDETEAASEAAGAEKSDTRKRRSQI